MTRRSRSTPALLVLVLAGLLSAACSAAPAAPAASAPTAAPGTAAPETAASPTPAPTAAAAPAGATMTIASFEYEVPASVRPGELVTVVNEDREAHTVTIDGGAVRLTVPGGAAAGFRAPAQVGDHPVVCDLHGGMDAVLVVA